MIADDRASDRISLTDSIRLERAVDAFEDAWEHGAQPAIEDYLPAEGPSRATALVELVHVDLERRLKLGEAIRVESYLRRYPELNEGRRVLELLAAEYRLRRQREAGAILAEYSQRFPQYGEEVTALLLRLPADGPEPRRGHGSTEVFQDVPPGSPGAAALTAPAEARSATPRLPDGPVSTASRYRVMHLHARGGLGEILVAWDEVLHREVALKLLQPGRGQDPGSRDRFLREAEITSQLEHPGIVPVYGLGQLGNGSPVYAMRFIRGETFLEAAERFHASTPPGADPGWRRLAFQQLLQRFLSVCNTIAYAHSQSILHRDLKPSNILVGEYGETIVVDWGLAKPFAADPARAGADSQTLAACAADGNEETQVGAVLGTPAYMSPEQAEGDWERVGTASDIYGLGATLYSLLTGQPPFQDALVQEVLRKVRHGDLVPPRQRNRHVPPALEAVCLKAMARRPEDRYPTALALADDVGRWLADEPVRAWPEPFVVRARRWLTRHPSLVAAAMVALVAGTLLAAVIASLTAANERDRWEKTLAEIKTEDARKELAAADREAYFYRINRASRDWWGNQGARAEQRLDECKPELRQWEWFFLKRCCQADLLTLRGHTAEVWAVAYSRDGRRLASASLDHTVRVWEVATGKLIISLKGHAGPVWTVAFSPDDQRLITGSDDETARLWDAATGKQVALLQQGAGEVLSCCFSGDGQRLAVATAPGLAGRKPMKPGTVRVWEVASGTELLTLEGHSAGVHTVAFSPDGKRLASGGFDRAVRIWDAQRGKELHTLTGHFGNVYTVAFSPDGQRLASASGDRTVRVWAVATGRLVHNLRAHGNQVWGVAFSPDGRRLASSSDDTTIKVWDASLGRLLFSLRGHTRGIAHVTFSPDGRRLASASDDQTVRLWDASGNQWSRTLCAHKDGVWNIAFSPDGRRLASASDDETVKVWDVATGQVLSSFTCGAGSAGVAFSPDGQRVASASDDQIVRVWSTATGREERVLRGHTAQAWAVAFSPDGKLLASASLDATVRLWDVATGEPVHVLNGHSARLWSVAFSPDGQQLASASADKTVKIWDVTKGELLLTLTGPDSPVLGIAFAPDGKTLAGCTAGIERVLTREPGQIRLWNLPTGEEEQPLQGQFGAITGVSFSPDGQRLVSGNADGTVTVWVRRTGQEMLTLYGHLGAVSSVAFSPDGQRVASGGSDGNVILWNGMPLADKRGRDP